MIKILILGNYCSSNRGDAAILSGLVTLIRDNIHDAQITVSSFYPEVANQVHNLESIEPIITTGRNFNKLWFIKKIILYLLYANGVLRNRIAGFLSSRENEVLQIYSQSDLIISAGGTYLNDNYKPTILGRLFELYLAKQFNKPVVLCGHSIGPFNHAWYKQAAKYVFNRMDLITLRDNKSASVLNEIGVSNTSVKITADTAFLINHISREEAQILIKKEFPGYDSNLHLVSVSVREWSYYLSGAQKQSHKEYIIVMSQLCDFLIDNYDITIVFLSTCTNMGGYGYDDRLTAHEVREQMKNKMKSSIIHSELTPEEIKGIYGLMELHVGTRMHSNIFALSMYTPVVAIAYEFKTIELMKDMQLDEYVVDIDHISLNTMIDKATKAWQTREMLAKGLPQKINKLKIQSLQNIELIRNLL